MFGQGPEFEPQSGHLLLHFFLLMILYFMSLSTFMPTFPFVHCEIQFCGGIFATRVPRTTARPIKPPKQKFAIFLKCLENSKNFKEYYSRVSDYEYLLYFLILWCCCGKNHGVGGETE
jgi:hypothetical protein